MKPVMASNTKPPEQQGQDSPGVAGWPGNAHRTEASPQQRTQGVLGPAGPAPELGSSDPAGCLAGTLLSFGHTVAPSVNLRYKLKV